MLGADDVDEELQRGFGLSINELKPLLKAGGDAAGVHGMLQILVGGGWSRIDRPIYRRSF
jgi:hypothetical protein